MTTAINVAVLLARRDYLDGVIERFGSDRNRSREIEATDAALDLIEIHLPDVFGAGQKMYANRLAQRSPRFEGE